ncbi:MAG: hypothetical protein WA224_19330, partial [Candidatus Acidiferrales bacterium]
MAVRLGLLMLVLAAATFSGSRENAPRKSPQMGRLPADGAPLGIEANPAGYVGSRVCAQCHAPISNKYSRTDMG